MRLAKAVVLLFCGVTLALCGAVIIPRAQHPQDAIPELGMCGEQVCFLGILPNTTKIETVQAAIKQTSNFELSILFFRSYSLQTI
jgi:hypothetical protein